MRHLLAAERVRFGKRRDVWILVAVVPLIMAAMFVMEFSAATSPPVMDFFIDPPDPLMEAEMREQMLAEWRQQLATSLPAFAFPASMLKVVGNLGPVVLLAIYLSVALTAGEFEWGTVRTLHLTSSRGRTLAIRFVLIVGLLAGVLLAALAIGAFLPILLRFEGRPIQDFAAPVPDLLAQIALRFAIVLPFAAIPALLAVLTRSMSLAFLLTLLFLAADLAFASTPFWASSPLPWLPAVSVTGSMNRLLGSPDAGIALAAPGLLSVIALLVWGILPMVAAVARFRRIDLNE